MKAINFILLAVMLLTACQYNPNLVQSESKKTNLKHSGTTYQINAIEAYHSLKVDGFVEPYIDHNRKAIAIDAAQYKNEYAAATYLFNGITGYYKVQLNALAELDGESKYRIAINGKLLKGVRTNPQIFGRKVKDYAPVAHVWHGVQLKKGDVIRVEFSSETNGKIPEGAITAYSRGRFTGLALIPSDKGLEEINLIDKDLSHWDIFMGAPHSTTDIEGYEKFDDVRIGTPIGLNKDPKKVFSVIEENGEQMIKITGEIFAGLVTKKNYENYYLTSQFKWGDKKWAPRLDKKRNSGVLYHSVGDYTDFWNVWMTSLEYEVQQTDCADFITIGEGKTDVEAKCPSKKIGDKYVFNPKGELNEFSWNDNYFETGRCFKPGDPEKAHGKWNTMELYCLGNKSIHLLNGQVMMVVIDPLAKLKEEWQTMTSGKIQLQSEAAEIFYKDMKIKPINELPLAIKSAAGL